MIKGNKYSNYISDDYQYIKKIFNESKKRNISESNFDTALLERCFPNGTNNATNDDWVSYYDMVIIKNLLINNYKTFYISSKMLFNFLSSCKIKNHEALNETNIIKSLRNPEMKLLKFETNEETFIGKINIWDHDRSIIFSIGKGFSLKDQNKINIAMVVENGSGPISSVILNNEENDTYHYSPESIPKIRLVFNMLLYMEAYPHLISSEPPPFFMKLDKNKQSYTINPNTDLISEDGSFTHEVSPHFRSGHFRRLQSDFYTHKKGQIVFVKSTFVKKNAVQVIDKNEVITL